MQGRNDNALPFLAVGRVKDAVTLAYYYSGSGEQEEQTRDVFRKLLQAASAKLTKGQRTRLQWNDGSVCCLMDDQGALLYCLVTSLLTYPEMLAYQLLYDLRAKVMQLQELETSPADSFNSALRPIMRDLVTRYEDPGNFPQLHAAVAGAKTRDVSGLGQGALMGPDGLPERNLQTKKVIACALVLILLIVIYLMWR
mmetsp:Transcript_83077/g.185439  ORF Transcript_83077/g.185439 Transcript_83077/m.185439 type:complete len:197 (-) Transcript_83077:195-785(-)